MEMDTRIVVHTHSGIVFRPKLGMKYWCMLQHAKRSIVLSEKIDTKSHMLYNSIYARQMTPYREMAD